MPNDPIITYLDAVKTRHKAATAGPWCDYDGKPNNDYPDSEWSVDTLNPDVHAKMDAMGDDPPRLDIIACTFRCPEDAAFCAYARIDVPRLEDMLRVAVGALEAMSKGPFELDPHKFSGAVLDRLRRTVEGEE